MKRERLNEDPSIELVKYNATKIMEDLCLQKLSLKSQMDTGIISIVDATAELEMISKKERKLKEQLIKRVHVTGKGELRSIHHHAPTPDNPKDYYVTKLSDGRRIKGATYDALISKLYAHYSDGLTDFSVGMIFKAAIKEKEVTENPNPNTINKDKADFNRFISDDFAKKDIRHVTDIDIKKYCQEWVTSEHPKKQAQTRRKDTVSRGDRHAGFGSKAPHDNN